MNGGDGGNGYGWDPSTLSPEEREQYERHERIKDADPTTMTAEEREAFAQEAKEYALDQAREYGL